MFDELDKIAVALRRLRLAVLTAVEDVIFGHTRMFTVCLIGVIVFLVALAIMID